MEHLTSRQNPLVKHLIKLRTQKRYRQATRRLVVTGRTVIQEIRSTVQLHTLLIPEGAPDPQLDAVRLITAPDSLLSLIGGLQCSSDWIAEVNLPQPGLSGPLSRLLILDGLADPGNVGTLLRTAFALKWDGVFLLSQTADPFNDKALRASRGALFHFPYLIGSPHDLKYLIDTHELHVYVATLRGSNPHLIQIKSPLALILGNEAHGPASEWSQQATPLTIDMHRDAESLNVAIAGGILLYQLGL